MAEFNINLMVNGGEISSDISKLTADSVEFVNANFTFDESWGSLYKTAVFRRGETVYHTVLENDKCVIPHEVLSDGMLYISVFGVLGNKRATTTETTVFIEKSGYVICVPTAPSDDPYAYFLEQSTTLKNKSQLFATACEQSAKQTQNDKEACGEYKEASQLAAEQSTTLYNKTLALSQNVEAVKEIVLSSEENVIELEDSAKNSAASALESYQKTTADVMKNLETHNSEENDLAHPQILKLANEAKNIALGKAGAICFDTKEQMDLWTRGEYIRPDGKTTNDLKIGDNLYILELEVPDFWWDGTTAQPLESEKPNLSDYYTKSQIDDKVSNALFEVISKTDYENAYLNQTLDAGRIYFVY